MLTSYQSTILRNSQRRNLNDQSKIIAAALAHYQLGSLLEDPLKLSGGLTNQVYQLKTTSGAFVIKIVDKLSPRARSLEDYQNIEKLQKFFFLTTQLPVLLARVSNREVVYQYENVFVLLYPYVKANTIGGPIGPVTKDRSRKAGELLGKIHAGQKNKFVDLNKVFDTKFEYLYTIDFNELKGLLSQYSHMNDFLDIALETEAAYDRSRRKMVYSHGDYQPHNILVKADELTIIDWELAGLINPEMELMIALITFSGLATENNFDKEVLQQFLHGYCSAGCEIQDNLDDAIGAALHKCWVNWIVFNMKTNNQAEVDNAYHSLKRMLRERDNLKQYINDYKLQCASVEKSVSI